MQYFRLGKNYFSEFFGGRIVPYPLSQPWTWFKLSAGFFCCWIRVKILTWLQIFTGGHMCLSTCCNNSYSDWLFYLLMLHPYLNYNNFHCGYNLALLVRYNKIFILIYWDECSIWFKTTRFTFWFFGMTVASSNLYLVAQLFFTYWLLTRVYQTT